MKHLLKPVAVMCICGAVYWLATGQYWDAFTYAAVGLGTLTYLHAGERHA